MVKREIEEQERRFKEESAKLRRSQEELDKQRHIEMEEKWKLEMERQLEGERKRMHRDEDLRRS